MRGIFATAALVLTVSSLSFAEHGVFPEPGEETWEQISDTGVMRNYYSDRICAIDGRNRLNLFGTWNIDADILRRWDGVGWKHIELPDDAISICAGPENIVLLGEGVNLGYIHDDEYKTIDMYYGYSDLQYTTCFENNTWALSAGPEEGLQRTNWRAGGGSALVSPRSIVYEIDAWNSDHKWAVCSSGGLYYQAFGGEWKLLEVTSRPMDGVWIDQVEPYGMGLAWALGDDGDLYCHNQDGFINIVNEGAPIPNGPITRIAVDREFHPWCSLANGQIARFQDGEWTHYTCEFLSGSVQDMT
ncbi:MAG: hypothetical protein JW941_06415, partial [Candidatus Coatesbacteria bacterium]|nr:hypothetical protein [Candidatus Coatesbacteria bacterium]